MSGAKDPGEALHLHKQKALGSHTQKTGFQIPTQYSTHRRLSFLDGVTPKIQTTTEKFSAFGLAGGRDEKGCVDVGRAAHLLVCVCVSLLQSKNGTALVLASASSMRDRDLIGVPLLLLLLLLRLLLLLVRGVHGIAWSGGVRLCRVNAPRKSALWVNTVPATVPRSVNR